MMSQIEMWWVWMGEVGVGMVEGREGGGRYRTWGGKGKGGGERKK